MAAPMTPKMWVGMLLTGGALYGAAVLAWGAWAAPAEPTAPTAPTALAPAVQSSAAVSESPPGEARQTGPTPPPPAMLPAVEDISQEPRSEGIGRTGKPPKGAVVFPDGTWLPPLNGVEDPPPFPGFGARAYAPVVRIETDPGSGMQWYRHANGSLSTVQMVLTSDGKRSWREPGWAVGHPVPSLPVR